MKLDCEEKSLDNLQRESQKTLDEKSLQREPRKIFIRPPRSEKPNWDETIRMMMEVMDVQSEAYINALLKKSCSRTDGDMYDTIPYNIASFLYDNEDLSRFKSRYSLAKAIEEAKGIDANSIIASLSTKPWKLPETFKSWRQPNDKKDKEPNNKVVIKEKLRDLSTVREAYRLLERLDASGLADAGRLKDVLDEIFIPENAEIERRLSL